MNNVYKIAGWIPISHEIALELDRTQRPWNHPDPPALPNIDPFPRLTKIANRIRQVFAP